jgi:hypothetical protein
MATMSITIQVETEAAKAFAAASPEEQRKMQLLRASGYKTSPRHRGSRCKRSWTRSVHALQRVASLQRPWSRCCVPSNVRVVMDTHVVVRAALLPHGQEEDHDYPIT